MVTAENGVEAFVRLAYESRPDVVVLDLMMPVIAGAEVLDHMRGDPRLVDVPVLLVTGARVPQDVSTAVDAILVKPFELDSLYETVAVLSRR